MVIAVEKDPELAELSEYAREYAASKGRTVKVSGNFYNLSPHYFAFEPYVDVLITETNDQSFRQPEWNRYSAGFARMIMGLKGDKVLAQAISTRSDVPQELRLWLNVST